MHGRTACHGTKGGIQNAREETDESRPRSQNVLIVGGGLAGLGLAANLLRLSDSVRVEVWDAQPEAGMGGASVAAAGLLHPFNPRGGKLWRGDQSFASAREMITETERETGDRVFINVDTRDGDNTGRAREKGILRLALNAKQENDYMKSAKKFPDEVIFVPRDKLHLYTPSVPNDARGGLLLKEGLTVDPKAYLKALWKKLHRTKRIKWRQISVEDFESDIMERIKLGCVEGNEDNGSGAIKNARAGSFDAIALTTGAGITKISALPRKIAITPCKGQNIEFRLKMNGNESRADAKLVKLPVISGRYLVPIGETDPDPQYTSEVGLGSRVIAGATFESDEDQMWCEGDFKSALETLRPILETIHPEFFKSYEPVRSFAGVRALPERTSAGSIPLCGPLGSFRVLQDAQESPTQKESSDALLQNDEEMLVWVLTGLGSRGLLYHSHLSSILAEALLSRDPRIIPTEVNRIEAASAGLDGGQESLPGIFGQ